MNSSNAYEAYLSADRQMLSAILLCQSEERIEELRGEREEALRRWNQEAERLNVVQAGRARRETA